MPRRVHLRALHASSAAFWASQLASFAGYVEYTSVSPFHVESISVKVKDYALGSFSFFSSSFFVLAGLACSASRELDIGVTAHVFTFTRSLATDCFGDFELMVQSLRLQT